MSPLARHAVLLVHGLGGQAGREAFLGFVGGPPPTKHQLGLGQSGLGQSGLGQSGVAEEGDRVASGPSLLPGLYGAPIEAVTWNHDPEATVLSQQPDTPPLWEGPAVTDFYELRCSGPFRRSGRFGRRVRGIGLRAGKERDELFSADRDAVVDLVEALHSARDNRSLRGYDRVTVVGHRWGGPIAAAALAVCWQRRRTDAPADQVGVDLAVGLADVESARHRLAVGMDRLPELELAALRSQLRQAQGGLHRLLRDEPRDPRRWLVSDLVTLDFPDHLATGASSLAAPAAVRWTNAWFRHDRGAGPLAPALAGAVEDVALGGPRFAGPGAGKAASYWAESAYRADREGSRLSIALLRRMVRRRPTLLLRTPLPPNPPRVAALAAELEQAARYPTARGAVLADVRLVVGDDPATATRWPLPVSTVPVPARFALREVTGLLGSGGRVTVLLSSDLLPPLRPA